MPRIFLLIACLFAALLPAQERFTDWTAQITPRADRSVDVTETLTVVSEGDVVKRGITRTLPETDRHPLRILSVQRDGREADYHTENKRGATTIYAGKADAFLSPGTYTYEIRYTIGNAVTSLEEVDELQVEIVGPDVSLPVERARAVLQLPTGLEATQYACYTGRSGSSKKDCTIAAPEGGQLSFTSTGTLGNGEGLSVAVGFEPGYFAEASAVAPAGRREPVTWWQGEGSLLAVVLGTIAGLLYGYRSWKQYGVDPEAPRVGTVFTPPDGLSPAALTYLNSATADAGTAGFTGTILYLATRGYLRIAEEEESGIFSTNYTYVLQALETAPSRSELAPEQRELFEQLFAEGRELRLEGKYDQRIQKIAKRHGEAVKEHYQDRRDIETNGWKVLPLVGIYAATLLPAVLLVKMDTTGFAIPALIAFFVLGLIGLIVYAWLIRKPSPGLVRLRTEIRSLKEYLGLSEGKRKQLINAPSMDRDHYEALLPYAVALGINTQWSNYFGDLLTQQHYHPVWIAGGTIFRADRFNDSFSSVIGASSTPPGSASGGGGSVGGGVGGGGAGGW
ncbi:putative membrane protein DUF2207 [Neolewinella xylanilytica]|uniref:Putative membrane protein DUF2207 n=1 Tax=Neolewinella xylanilytica TaxID=1514080 RepID=A0A2S6I3M9_9BACT|nr:DUF2207 domain-containing protein [Neolewinella xylanilytica]PPK85786.1 putative membrane protein DUF2207 [Neolewinella xylanilytica]